LPVKGKKPVIIGVIVIVVIILVANALYMFIIPRVNLEIVTLYNEGIGGGGTGGMININTKLKNSGTVSIEDIEITITVMNETNVQRGDLESTGITLDPSEDQELKLNFIGNHYLTYFIFVDIIFYASGDEYTKSYSYKTYEDPMNIKFEDDISDWGF
jgi:hypothetical protein